MAEETPERKIDRRMMGAASSGNYESAAMLALTLSEMVQSKGDRLVQRAQVYATLAVATKD